MLADPGYHADEEFVVVDLEILACGVDVRLEIACFLCLSLGLYIVVLQVSMATKWPWMTALTCIPSLSCYYHEAVAAEWKVELPWMAGSSLSSSNHTRWRGSTITILVVASVSEGLLKRQLTGCLAVVIEPESSVWGSSIQQFSEAVCPVAFPGTMASMMWRWSPTQYSTLSIVKVTRIPQLPLSSRILATSQV